MRVSQLTGRMHLLRINPRPPPLLRSFLRHIFVGVIALENAHSQPVRAFFEANIHRLETRFSPLRSKPTPSNPPSTAPKATLIGDAEPPGDLSNSTSLRRAPQSAADPTLRKEGQPGIDLGRAHPPLTASTVPATGRNSAASGERDTNMAPRPTTSVLEGYSITPSEVSPEIRAEMSVRKDTASSSIATNTPEAEEEDVGGETGRPKQASHHMDVSDSECCDGNFHIPGPSSTRTP